MSRPVTDPRIVEVLAAFDRQRTSPSYDKSILGGFVRSVTDSGLDVELIDGWTDDALRAILTAFAVLCPEHELDDMVTRAREQNEWIAEFERGAA